MKKLPAESVQQAFMSGHLQNPAPPVSFVKALGGLKGVLRKIKRASPGFGPEGPNDDSSPRVAFGLANCSMKWAPGTVQTSQKQASYC